MRELHSKYNPQAEARRYIDVLDISADVKYFILIEPGLGYIIPVLRAKFPKSKIIALHADPSLPVFDVPTFYGNENLQNCLEKEIQNCEAGFIRVIEWRPSLDVYGEAYLKLISETIGFIKRIDAGFRTEKAFGRRWFKNFIRNASLIEHALLYKTTDIPVIFAASGPSLENSFPLIRRYEDRCFIIAASSAAAALAHNGIRRDLIITTDGGGWALRHLYCCYRDKADIGLALNLSAALPCQYSGAPLLVINDGSLWQSLILREYGIPSVIIPQMGTVSASAVELSLQLTSSNIYIAGMDLALDDIRSHARPYGFDAIFWEKASRFSPYYRQSFIRSKQIKEGGSMDIYAGWFKNRPRSDRVFKMEEGVLENFSFTRQVADIKKTFLKRININKNKTDSRKKILSVLLNALEDGRYAAQLSSELSSLLFSGVENVKIDDIKNTITELTDGKK